MALNDLLNHMPSMSAAFCNFDHFFESEPDSINLSQQHKVLMAPPYKNVSQAKNFITDFFLIMHFF
jgi:20S proteasome subunit beta 5